MLALAVILVVRASADLQFSMTRVDLPVQSEGSSGGLPLRVAVLGDLHVGHGVMDLDALRRLFDAVIAEGPDMIALVGDYAHSSRHVDQLRLAVAEVFGDVSVRGSILDADNCSERSNLRAVPGLRQNALCNSGRGNQHSAVAVRRAEHMGHRNACCNAR
ncbi:MAG: metallophosphoesterase [Gammaproteobacteria bacterium]|nr:metallophosphoesterase [Gammaproteobacteria bacterium]